MRFFFFAPSVNIFDIFSPQLSHFSPCVIISFIQSHYFPPLLFVVSVCPLLLWLFVRRKKKPHPIEETSLGYVSRFAMISYFLCIWLSCDCIWVTDTVTTASLSICRSVSTSRIDLPELFGVIETVMHLFSVQWILICSAYEMDL